MAGTILENLSGKKLAIISVVLIICQIVCFLVGALIAPAPSNVQTVIGTKCIRSKKDARENTPKFYIPRAKQAEKRCFSVNSFDDPYINRNRITANQIVFAYQIPIPKDGLELDFSRWQQNLISVLQFDILHKKDNPMKKKSKITFEISLGYRNKWDPEDEWKLLANATEERNMDCEIDKEYDKDGMMYNCSVLPLFELGSLHHDYYLINMILPTDSEVGFNVDLRKVEDVWLVAINQNGGFTQVLLSMKTVFFVLVVVAMIWFWRRVRQLARPLVLIEKMLLVLGGSVLFLDFPLEYLTLVIDMPYMLLFSDIRQGIFYASLLSFWLVFTGEHLMDDVHRNRINIYWRHLSAVVFGCLCLFIFDVCERGVQFTNPFYSIWVTDTGTNLALAFIVLAGLSACLYFIFLCYMVFRVFRNISFKRSTLPSMSKARRLHYEGIIYRFRFMMITSLLCAALTVISYIVGQVSEGRWKWDDDIKIQYVSAFFTGVYGMWNLYVIALTCFYAPSHKTHSFEERELKNSSQEELEFSRLTSEPGEASSLTEFAKKAALE
ncbi:Protein wntless [Nymphon striatum]|nr:Protein wntless [Nymphon striatum]